MTGIRVRVDKTLCGSYGVCVLVAPTYFELGDDGISQPLRSRPEAEQPSSTDLLNRAAQRCPTGAITLVS